MILRPLSHTPAHHPSVETLTAYAAGVIRAGFDVVTAVHVRGCAQCRRDVAAFECVGGVVLSETPGVAVSDEALARVMARMDGPAPSSRMRRSLDDLLYKAKRRWVAPGVWVAKVDTPHADDDRVYMLSAAPGAVTAMHTHSGVEFTQILSGALFDEGVTYSAGDFTERNIEHTHKPHTVSDEPCICLFATHGRLAPTDFIGRIAFALADV